MKIAVSSVWFSEHLMAKMFLDNHFTYADMITIFLETVANQETKDILTNYKSPEGKTLLVFPTVMSDGLDDGLKRDIFNRWMHAQIGIFDWVGAFDSDELIEAPEHLRSKLKVDCVNVHFLDLYRHHTEADFDPNGPVTQRRHGTKGLNIKPCLVRPNKIFQWHVGQHHIDGTIPSGTIMGLHLGMCDPVVGIQRRLDRKQRMSKNNLDRKWGHHNNDITKEQILTECKEHENDLQVW